jgi:hypothetical protein
MGSSKLLSSGLGSDARIRPFEGLGLVGAVLGGPQHLMVTVNARYLVVK